MLLHSLLFLLILKTCTAKKQTVPVFLIDYDNVLSHSITIQANPFVKISQDIFKQIIKDAETRSKCVIIFAENNLSTEDLSISDNVGTPYYHLQKGLKQRKSIYIPAVTEPFDSLKRHFSARKSNTFYLGGGVKLKLLNSVKYLYVYFKTNNRDLSRVRTLRQHDIIMREVYFTVRQLKPGPIIAFYTGMVNPVTVESTDYTSMRAVQRNMNYGVMVVSQQSLFRLSGVLAASHSRRSWFNQKPVVEREVRTARSLSTTMQYTDFELQFNFYFKEMDWKLANVALMEGGEEVGRTKLEVGAPWNWSYSCAAPLIVVNARDGSSITVVQYQIQPIYRPVPFYPNKDDKNRDDVYYEYDRRHNSQHDYTSQNDSSSYDRKLYDNINAAHTRSFGKTVNCEPYFTITILAGLLITVIITIIASVGILVLISCQVNSKFDDVYQKALLIPVEK